MQVRMGKYHWSVICESGKLWEVAARVRFGVPTARVVGKEVVEGGDVFKRTRVRVSCIAKDNIAQTLESNMTFVLLALV